MQQSDSFEALGSAKPNSPDTGFRTYGTLLAYGVNAQGVHVGSKHGAGVYAESMLQSPGARASQAKSRSGVWGTGDHYGVYGASDLLYGVGGPQPQTDETPILSPDLVPNTHPNAPGATGGVGVVGASLNVPGVIGASGVTNLNFPKRWIRILS